ncbi:50S ribosomal protein L19 [Candidatus Woesebacteria bacterium]|nr:50S ribosomal protein L19 [Candidatus Woesebacteria bacterium]
MANSITYQETHLQVGDTVAVDYRIKENDNKERIQQFKGILIAIKGTTRTSRMITVRKMSKMGIGVERIFPIESPFISAIKMEKKSTYTKAKLYFLEDLSDQNLRKKLYKQRKLSAKKNVGTKAKTTKVSAKKSK